MRVPTIFSGFERKGAKILIVTAKVKLRKLLGHGLTFGRGGWIWFRQKRILQFEENGCEDLLNLTGLPLPNVYSADLSEFVFEIGAFGKNKAGPHLFVND